MSVIPTTMVEHRHIPMPWAVGHCAFGFFILKSRQINFYLKSSSCLPWLATLLRNSCLVWMQQTLFTLSIQTVSSWRGWASQRVPKNPWGSLSPMPSSALAYLFWVNVRSLNSTFSIIVSSGLPIGGSFQAQHPFFNIIGSSQSLGGLFAFCCSHPDPLAFIFLSTTA